MTAGGGRRGGLRAASAGIVAIIVFVLPILPGASGATPPTPCAATSGQGPQSGHTMPPGAPAMFAADFPVLYDCEWGYRLGGFGGVARRSELKHIPVVFVHGNQADAENWFLVQEQFKALASYTGQEMYAISYNGLGNAYAGLPTRSGPSPQSTAYWQANPTAVCCNGGHGAQNEGNVPDLYAFVQAVQDYTGSERVDIVAHSLGVTITRRMLQLHPGMRDQVVAGVMIAGGNHGTTVCRGLDASYYGCNEIAPGTPWLAALNADGETPGPTRWMTVYNGTDNVDPYFSAYPPLVDDHQSPALAGATNLTFPQTYHNDLRVDPAIVPIYLRFLLDTGQPQAASTPTQVVPGGPAGLPNTSRQGR